MDRFSNDTGASVSGTRLAGKVAIVTGAGHEGEVLGTGAAISILFAAQGASVGLVDVSPQRAANTEALISRAGGRCAIVIGDVSVQADCSRAVAEVADRFGSLDVLVNNAGVVGRGSVEEVDETHWDQVFDVNVKGVLLMSRFAIPLMRRGGGGSIVNVSSIAAIRGFGSPSYAASKGGVLALTTDMAYSYGRSGIRVNCIVPGHLYTPMGNTGGSELREARRKCGLLGTEGTAWDVAWAALFLACEESRWITAVALPVDAGTTAATALAMRSLVS